MLRQRELQSRENGLLHLRDRHSPKNNIVGSIDYLVGGHQKCLGHVEPKQSRGEGVDSTFDG